MQTTIEFLSTTPLRQVTRSVYYPGFLPQTPDLFVWELPSMLKTETASRYRAIFIETDADRRMAEAAMDSPLKINDAGRVDTRLTIDRLAKKPSSIPTSRSMGVLLYVPPAPEWPHFVVVMMPSTMGIQGLSRGRYSYDVFEDEASAQDFMASLMMLEVSARTATGLPFRTPPIVVPDTSRYS